MVSGALKRKLAALPCFFHPLYLEICSERFQDQNKEFKAMLLFHCLQVKDIAFSTRKIWLAASAILFPFFRLELAASEQKRLMPFHEPNDIPCFDAI